MASERNLILVLTVVAVTVGTTAAVTRPFLFRLGQEGVPSGSSSGISYRGSYHGGRWVSRPGSRADWSGFQGRGPGTAK
jgi:hypothetical protein